MLYIRLFIEREKNIGQSAPECPFNEHIHYRSPPSPLLAVANVTAHQGKNCRGVVGVGPLLENS